MKYIKLFQNHLEYEGFVSGGTMLKPNVSHCVSENEVHYKPKGYESKYLTFKALEGGSFTLNIGSAVSTNILESISYSTDNGQSWETTNNVDGQTVTIVTPTVNAGDSILWKGLGSGVSTTTNNNNRPSTSSIFSSTGTFNVEGNILSLLYGDEFEGKDSVTGTYNFALLFYADKSRVSEVPKVVSAKNLVLPIKNAPTGCYFRMFQENQLEEYTLIEAPLRIDSESVGVSACTSMFYSCTSLTVAPELPATTLSDYSYYSMFYGCTSLVTAPVLPATTLARSCYQYMFQGCTSLTTAPVLPATTLAQSCYGMMFDGCTSLTTAPQLPATTLVEACYWNMFASCTSLTTAPELPATTLARLCYGQMFYGCTSLTTAPELSATTLADSCYTQMFARCTSLTTPPPTLPATTLSNYCCSDMFSGCTSLTTAPELPATTLAKECYYRMFYGCTSLTTAPELPATTLVSSCYTAMFRNCTRLNYIKAMFTTTPSTTYTDNWVNGIASSGTFVKNTAAEWNVSGVHGIPTGWTVQTASV